jgi:hypothetical protein
MWRSKPRARLIDDMLTADLDARSALSRRQFLGAAAMLGASVTLPRALDGQAPPSWSSRSKRRPAWR